MTDSSGGDRAVIHPQMAVLDSIVPNYVVGMIYGCLVEAYASEQNARMTAMQSATDSAQEMLKDLIYYSITGQGRQRSHRKSLRLCAGAKAQITGKGSESRYE